jgi:LmbE family N-acetylglucosaminyl deacetylase
MSKSIFLNHASTVLVLCAHTDDEFGCAGTIFQLIKENFTIKYVALSRCEESVPAPYPKDILEHECRKCTQILGIMPSNVDIWNYQVRHFPAHRQEILENFVQIKRDYNPDLVFLPSSYDTHQDHMTVYQEGFRAFKNSSILGYELPQNLTSFNNSAFIRLTEESINKKLEALSEYKSQTSRNYASECFIKGLASVRGVQCNAKYAEAYEVIRLIL